MRTELNLISSYIASKPFLLILSGSALLLATYYFAFVYQDHRPRSAEEQSRAREVLRKSSDVALAGRVRSAITLSKRLSAYAIGVEARDGAVTLTGNVPSEVERDLAESLTAEIAGVKQLSNRIQIQPGAASYGAEVPVLESDRLEDLEMRADLRERLLDSPDLKAQQIQVAVQNRVVTLQGYVESDALRARAEQAARGLPKVSAVVNRLKIGQPKVGTPHPANDRELSQQISAALADDRDNFVNPAAIKAECAGGTVTLSGTVASRAERALAERIARSVPGVRAVNNQLAVADRPQP